MSATTTTDCGCGCGGSGGGGVGCVGGGGQMLQRPRFFARQLVTPSELNLAGEYVLERLRRHNRLLHGWGVACGAQVCRVPGDAGAGALPWKVKIRPGHLIDGHGNEVTIDVDRVVDLRVGVTSSACGDPPGEVRDPWCRDVYTEQEGARRVWVAVCHAEQRGRPVRTQPTGCGCDESGCEYSRWMDGYEVRLLDACPPSHQGPPPTLQEMAATLTGPLPDCPPCPADPCVVLAVVDLAEDGTITGIDNCSCRRMLVSTASLWWRCGGVVKIGKVQADPEGPYQPGTKGVGMTVTGEGIATAGAIDVDLGPGIDVTFVGTDDGTLTITFDVADDAEPGDRTLTLSTHDCSSATLAKAITVDRSK